MLTYRLVLATKEAISLKKAQWGNRTLGESRLSRDGLVQLWVPTGWKERPIGADSDASLKLGSPSELVFVNVVSEDPSEFESLQHYAAALQKNYLQGSERSRAKQFEFRSFGSTESFQINGRPALRLPFEATLEQRIDFEGHLYCVRGPTHFHQILAYGVDSAYRADALNLASMIKNAELRGGGQKP